MLGRARSCTAPSSPLLTLQTEVLPYDERPLPVTRKQLGEASAEPEVREADSDVRRRGVSGEPEPLTEKALREASSAIDTLGEALVKKENQVMHTVTMACTCAHGHRRVYMCTHTQTAHREKEGKTAVIIFTLFNVCVSV